MALIVCWMDSWQGRGRGPSHRAVLAKVSVPARGSFGLIQGMDTSRRCGRNCIVDGEAWIALTDRARFVGLLDDGCHSVFQGSRMDPIKMR